MSATSSVARIAPIGSPPAIGFASVKQIGLDRRLLVREEGPGASESTLDFVEDQEDFPRSRQLAHRAQELRVEHANAAFALHRFDDHRRDRFRIQRDVELFDVALDDRDAAGQRPERRAIRGPVGRGERAEQASMECAAQRDDLVLAHRPCARAQRRANLNAPSFASAPELQKKTRSANDSRHERLGEPLARRGAVEVRHVHETVERARAWRCSSPASP